MPAEPDPLWKSLADEMARMLSGSGGPEALLLMQRLGLLSPAERSAPAGRPGFVGIWEGGPQGFLRSPAFRNEWGLWADVPSIPPKGERPRVLLAGESVARGFLYDPELNPAQSLAASLTAALGRPVEIVDLAKSDLLAPDLAALLLATPALAPDAVVVFAGNNWFPREKRDRHIEAAALRERGVPGLRELREERLFASVLSTLRPPLLELAERLPVVVVVPEINLADWRLDAEADAPWLPPGANRRWLECRAAARSALTAGGLDAAEALAREMVDLDGGTAASGWTLAADCARARGDLAAARSCLERARDTHLWDYTHQTPRAYSPVQRALRGLALPGRIAVVDLPRCFSERYPGELPGRRLFLDYCHMTSEGIRVAMAATAREVAALLDPGRPLPDLASLVAAAPAPTVEVEAAAHFAAALHSAHWGQSSPFVSYLCREAARRSPEVAQAMRAYLEIQTRRAPAWACRAVERLASATPFLRGYILLHQDKLFDPVLLPAIATALEENGLPSRTFLYDLQREERSLTERPRDLLDPYHRASWADLDWLEWPTHYRRAYSPMSRFPWVSGAPRETAFSLTCRRRGEGDPVECRASVNGTPVARLSLLPEWGTFRFSAPAGLVQAGVNWLEIEWPLGPPGHAEEIARVAAEHEMGRFVPLLPVFAEISALSAVQR